MGKNVPITMENIILQLRTNTVNLWRITKAYIFWWIDLQNAICRAEFGPVIYNVISERENTNKINKHKMLGIKFNFTIWTI